MVVVVELWLDSILKVFSNPNNSKILKVPSSESECHHDGQLRRDGYPEPSRYNTDTDS